jgi:hypothetical protein
VLLVNSKIHVFASRVMKQLPPCCWHPLSILNTISILLSLHFYPSALTRTISGILKDKSLTTQNGFTYQHKRPRDSASNHALSFPHPKVVTLGKKSRNSTETSTTNLYSKTSCLRQPPTQNSLVLSTTNPTDPSSLKPHSNPSNPPKSRIYSPSLLKHPDALNSMLDLNFRPPTAIPRRTRRRT